MATAGADGSGSGDGGDDGDDGGGGPCSLSPSQAPLRLGDSSAAPGRVTGLAVAGTTSVACGAGFVAVVGAGMTELVGTCTGLAVVDDTTVVAVTDSGDVTLVGLSGGPTVLATASAGGPVLDVAANGTTIAVAMGGAGVAAFDASAGALVATGSLTTALDVAAIGVSGDGWLVGGPEHITALGSDGSTAGALEIRGTVTDIEVSDGVGLVSRGPFGFDFVDVSGGLSSILTHATEGTAIDGAWSGGSALVATGAAVHRYELGDGAVALSARAARPDASLLAGEWVGAVASDGATTVASVGMDVHSAEVGEATQGAVALLPRTTTSLFGEGDGEVVVLVRNGGNVDMHVGDLELDGPLTLSSVDGAEPRQGCPDQWSVAPGGSLLVTLEGPIPDAATTVDLRLSTSDPNHTTLPLPVEINRPSLAVGQMAPDFTLMSFAGEVVDLDATRGEVVFLKLFSYS